MNALRLTTWNINSVRTRLPAILAWVEKNRPDVVCLQETKVQDDAFPAEAIRAAGYDCFFTGQKAYNGVAILSSRPVRDVSVDFEQNPDPTQRRYIAATVEGIRLINVYIPNGAEVDSSPFFFKLAFINGLSRHLAETCSSDRPLAILGDFNVAPEPRDVYDPAALEGEILFHPKERQALAELRAWGLTDLFRLHHQEAGHFTWWDYRMNAFRRNLGLRIDHIWATRPLARTCIACEMDRGPRSEDRPSDHIPVTATFRIR